MRTWKALVLGALLCGLTSGSAEAATVKVEGTGPCTQDFCVSAFVYKAGAREANRLTITPRRGGALFVDSGAKIRPGKGCARARRGVFCKGDATRLGVQLRDGDDRVDASAIARGAQIDGGSGADLVIGTSGNDLLAGNAGSDRLLGGPGDDQLNGDGVFWPVDDLNDRRQRPDARPARDRIDGQRGADLVTYEYHRGPVRVNLSAGTGGARGEGDRLKSVSDVVGSRRGDSITGNAGANALVGGPGADRIDGSGGADTIGGEQGHDRLRGGSGNDKFSDDEPGLGARDTDRISCGSGADKIFLLELTDFVSTDCDGALDGHRLRLRLPLRSVEAQPFVPPAFSCPKLRCTTTVTVTLARATGGAARGSLLGTSVSSAEAGRRVASPPGVSLTPLARGLLRRGATLVAYVRVTTGDAREPSADSYAFTTSLALRR